MRSQIVNEVKLSTLTSSTRMMSIYFRCDIVRGEHVRFGWSCRGKGWGGIKLSQHLIRPIVQRPPKIELDYDDDGADGKS
jgi:hypothetical protein